MDRIIIIGSAGAGKSTLARTLGQRLQINVIHLDALYWKPGWDPIPRDEWQSVVHQIVARDRWIIDGNYGSTLDIRLTAADTVIFLDFPRQLCLWRVVQRWIMHYGRSRPDMGPGCPEKVDWEFIRWIWTFPEREKQEIMRRIGQHSGNKNVYVLRNQREVDNLIRSIK